MYKNSFYDYYIIGDKMKELLWDLFRKTGKIEYYIKYKEVVNDRKRRGNNIKY